MHYTIKAYIIPFIIFCCIGCSFSKPGINISQKNYETDNAVISIEIPEFKNLNDKNFEDTLNSDYNSLVNQWIDDFTKVCPENPSEKCQFTLTQDVKLSSPNFISIVGEAYIFTEGVHGSLERVVKNIDAKNNTEVKLSDLFLDEEYPSAINREIENILKEKSEEYHDLWEKPILSSMHETLFYLTNDDLVIFYPPYELSYYARGFVEFCIPYEKLTGYLKPEYANP